LRTHSRNSQQIDLRNGAPHQIPRGPVESCSRQKISKKIEGNGTKKTPLGILKNKDTPVANKKKSTPKSVIPPTPGVNNSDTVRAKGKKKKGGRKVSFDGKKAAKPTKLCKQSIT
jgi:hypothetical protein